MNKDLKNILRLIGIVAYVVAVIGGIGYTCYLHKYLIAVCIVYLAVLAFPTWRKLWPGDTKE